MYAEHKSYVEKGVFNLNFSKHIGRLITSFSLMFGDWMIIYIQKELLK